MALFSRTTHGSFDVEDSTDDSEDNTNQPKEVAFADVANDVDLCNCGDVSGQGRKCGRPSSMLIDHDRKNEVVTIAGYCRLLCLHATSGQTSNDVSDDAWKACRQLAVRFA